MADTVFSSGTVVSSDWLNAINTFVYRNKVNACLYGLSVTKTAAENNTALQNSIVAATLTGQSIYIPGYSDGYDISEEFTLPDNISIFGDGSLSKLNQTVNGKNIFILGNDCTVSGMCFEFTVVGNNLDFTKQNAIYANGKYNLFISNNTIILKDIHSGIQLRDCFNISIIDNLIYGGVWDGSTAGPAANASDIIFYSTTNGGRTVITGNKCFSNNSQGIFFTAIGLDSDSTISNNVCVTLKPSGKYEETTGGVRRHGIVASYTSTNPSRITINSNVIRNTRWTGIYAQGSGNDSSGEVVISNNVISNTGYETGNSLSGGIFITLNGQEIVSNNIITDYRNNINAVGGITVTCPTVGGVSGASITGNNILNSSASGIALVNRAKNILVGSNYIKNSTRSDIYVSLTASDTALGGLEIDTNTIIRNNHDFPSITFNAQSGAVKSRIFGNKLRGDSKAAAVSTNIGININSSSQEVDVIYNLIDTFYYGINVSGYFTAGTRYHSELCMDFNSIQNCTQGIGASSTAATCTVLIEGNVFKNTTSNTGTGTLSASACLKIGRRMGTSMEYFVTAVPTTGTATVGDRAKNIAGTIGSPKAWTCTTAGSPGTWTSEGNL